VAFVENTLVRLVIEGVLDLLKFSEVVPFEVAQYRLHAKRAGIAILGETGLSFHDWPIIQVFRLKAINYLASKPSV
jgi:hypothetical protein